MSTIIPITAAVVKPIVAKIDMSMKCLLAKVKTRTGVWDQGLHQMNYSALTPRGVMVSLNLYKRAPGTNR